MERRRHLRLTAMGLARIEVQGGAMQDAYLVSIGRGGLGVYVHDEIPEGQLAMVGLPLLDRIRQSEELKIMARVQWVRPVGRLYMAGLRFERMSDKRFRLLLQHLNLIEELQLNYEVLGKLIRAKTQVSIKD